MKDLILKVKLRLESDAGSEQSDSDKLPSKNSSQKEQRELNSNLDIFVQTY